jgi:copper chaperone
MGSKFTKSTTNNNTKRYTMKTIQFKTNIKCSGCVATVTPGLNKTAGENNWTVDLQSPDKVLTVSAEGLMRSP